MGIHGIRSINFQKIQIEIFKAVEINGNFAAVSMSPANQDLKPVLYMFQYKDNTWTPISNHYVS
jgi:hypothetical protein